MMKYSIIIPIYNAEKFLHNCLDSIISQNNDKLLNNFEVILVDDGSNDNSYNICCEYSSNFNNFQVIHKKNGGVTSARKKALEYANGEYVIPIDSDDMVDPDYLLRIDSIINLYKPDVICFSYTFVDKYNKKHLVPISKNIGYYDCYDLQSKIFPYIFDNPYGEHFEYNIWAKCFNLKIFKSIQSQINDSIIIGEDAIVTRFCILNSKSMYIDNYFGYYYNYNVDSAIHSKKPISFTDLESRITQYRLLLDNFIIFEEGYYRSMIHDIFNVVVSQFYSETPFYSLCKELNFKLNSKVYSNIINYKCKLRGKLLIAKLLLKYRMYILIRLVSFFKKR